MAPNDIHQADVGVTAIDQSTTFSFLTIMHQYRNIHRLLQDIDLTNAGVSGQGRLQRFRLKPFLQDLEGGLESYFKTNTAF